MTSEEGDLQLAQSYSPYGEELEEIGSEPATFGYGLTIAGRTIV